jgi:hypothetical protein
METLVQGIEVSEVARERAKVMLLTLGGQWSVRDGYERLGMKRTRFQDLRRQMLRAAVGALEGGASGRPRRRARGDAACVTRLRSQVRELTHELRLVRAQLDVAESGVGEVVRRRKAQRLAPRAPGRK